MKMQEEEVEVEDVPTSTELSDDLADVVVLPTRSEEALALSTSRVEEDFVMIERDGTPLLLLHLGNDLLQLLCEKHLNPHDVLALCSVCHALRRLLLRRSLWQALLLRDHAWVVEGERIRREALGLSPAWTVLARRQSLTAAQLKDAYLRARRFVAGKEWAAIPFCVLALDFSSSTATVLDALDVMAGSASLCLKTGHSVAVVVHLYSAAPQLHVLSCLSRWSYGLEVFRSLGLSGHPSPVEADRERTRRETVENRSGRAGVHAAQLSGREHGAFALWTLPKTTLRKSHYKMLVFADRDPIVDQYPGCHSAANGAPLDPCFQVTLKFES